MYSEVSARSLGAGSHAARATATAHHTAQPAHVTRHTQRRHGPRSRRRATRARPHGRGGVPNPGSPGNFSCARARDQCTRSGRTRRPHAATLRRGVVRNSVCVSMERCRALIRFLVITSLFSTQHQQTTVNRQLTVQTTVSLFSFVLTCKK